MKKLILLSCVSASALAMFACKSTSDSSCNLETSVYEPIVGEGYYITSQSLCEKPRFNGADIFGVRPNAPFLYTMAVTGKRPMTFAAEGLPTGLSLDPKTGIISGKIADPAQKTYSVVFKASNDKGVAERNFDIVVGEDIMLTPPMGWSTWIATKKTVSQDKVEKNVKDLLKLKLDQYGYNYVNVDDAWQAPYRGGKFNAIMADKIKFPNIEGLIDDIHAKGLKFGIYSTPWVTSYAGYIGGSSNNKEGKWDTSMIWDKQQRNLEGSCSEIGKYFFDDNDAKQWADWGVDYMKYDWNPNDADSIIRMSKALRNSGRDIVFSISNSAPISQGDNCKKYVQVFRTGGDLRARWAGKGEHTDMYSNWVNHNKWIKEAYAGGPGHTPDADFFMVGLPKYGAKELLTADELYHHVSSFVLWGGPLLISSNIEALTPFDVSLLTNVEILDLNQDRMSTPGQLVYDKDGISVILKKLANGDKAFGIFNFNDAQTVATIDWDTLELEGVQALRDVWRKKDIGLYKDSFSAKIPRHGVVVIRAKGAKK